jgi:hypothetical protein
VAVSRRWEDARGRLRRRELSNRREAARRKRCEEKGCAEKENRKNTEKDFEACEKKAERKRLGTAR